MFLCTPEEVCEYFILLIQKTLKKKKRYVFSTENSSSKIGELKSVFSESVRDFYMVFITQKKGAKESKYNINRKMCHCSSSCQILLIFIRKNILFGQTVP